MNGDTYVREYLDTYGYICEKKKKYYDHGCTYLRTYVYIFFYVIKINTTVLVIQGTVSGTYDMYDIYLCLLRRFFFLKRKNGIIIRFWFERFSVGKSW